MESEPETVDFGKTVTPDYPAVIRSAVTMALNEHTTNHNWYMAGKYGTAGASALAALWAAALVYCTRQSVRENEQEIARYRAHLDGGRAPTHT